ncbi:hypothetical protein PLICBS_009497 [Purpureocillium lilacinum]|uniref:uncharacterized protein n=1 Tax=Purpureocillium lilacinum TaxID=33203 RepID=UPI00208728D5|nr:hypothetical protein PLICBS_009497 [Purpureocillium lilacinum]
MIPNPTYSDKHRVTVEEVDTLLQELASRTKWSSPAIRSSQAGLTTRDRGDLEGVYRRLNAMEAKWLTRLVLKDYRPLILDSRLVYQCCHPVLPAILQIQDDFAAAINALQAAKSPMLPNSSRQARLGNESIASIKPRLGIKVGRQNWFKARSIKHCSTLGYGRMSVENKIDGEYCQIHIDATRDPPRIQIFSKSGKDSTEDRQGLRGFKLLERTIRCDKGRAELVPRQVVDFGGRYAISDLRQAFAKTIVERGEGLVLKPDDPYFNFHDSSKRFSGLCIKLKKEYIGNFGDIGDFAVVGAGFNASKARSYMIPDLKWTHFFLGCLENREEVKRWNATPEFTVVTVVELNETQLKSLLAFGNPMPVEPTINVDTRLKIPRGLETNTPMCFAFRNPLVFDLRCFSFDKPGNMGFWTPRFPAVSKIHFDRDYTDTISLEELQEKAKEATTGPDMDDSQENLAWIARLEGADPRGRAVDAVSQLTATTMPTPSPVKSTQATSESDPRLSPVAFRSVGRASVNLGQVLHTATMEFAVPQVPLITPPSSSLPEEAASPTACRNPLTLFLCNFSRATRKQMADGARPFSS